MKYEMQILITDKSNKKFWKSIRQMPTMPPYQYDTELEAYRMLKMLYGSVLCSDEMRILKVS